jgi:predicted small lipoprotein YifL
LKTLFAALVVLAVVALGLVACGTHGGAPSPRDQAAEQPPWDAGLPVPKASGRRSVIVPSDMGLGTGPSGSTNNGQAPSPLSPSTNSGTGQ